MPGTRPLVPWHPSGAIGRPHHHHPQPRVPSLWGPGVPKSTAARGEKLNAKEAKRTAAVFSHVYVGSRQEKTLHKNRTPGLWGGRSPHALLHQKGKQRLVGERRRRPVRHRLAGGFVRSHPTYRWVCSARVYFECGRLAEEASGGSEIPIVNAAVTCPGPVVGLARWASTRRHHRSCCARRGTNPRDAASPRRSWPTNWTPVC